MSSVHRSIGSDRSHDIQPSIAVCGTPSISTALNRMSHGRKTRAYTEIRSHLVGASFVFGGIDKSGRRIVAPKCASVTSRSNPSTHAAAAIASNGETIQSPAGEPSARDSPNDTATAPTYIGFATYRYVHTETKRCGGYAL